VTVTRAPNTSYLSSADLSDRLRSTLFDIAWPDRRGRNLSNPIKVRRGEPENFIVQAPFGNFLWVGPLLTDQKPASARHLDCYHNNTWNSLILAWIHATTFDAAATQKSVLPLAQANAAWYAPPSAEQPDEILTWFGNASLKRFIADLGLVAKAAALPSA
jgi:hypothetical protein